MRTIPGLLDGVETTRVEVIEDSKRYGALLIASLKDQAACAAYREALKNVMRSKPSKRMWIARKALFGKNVQQRGKAMLKVFKAAVQVWYFSRNGTEKDFCAAIQCLEGAMENFELKGPSVRKWLRKKELANG